MIKKLIHKFKLKKSICFKFAPLIAIGLCFLSDFSNTVKCL